MTADTLSKTPWETVYEEDNTLPAGTEKVKVTPYGGAKVKSYRNVYDKNGNLISSTFEASSDYKVRNKVIVKGPAKADVPVSDPGQQIPAVPETPTVPTTPTTPTVPDTPVEPPVEETPDVPTIVVLPTEPGEPSA